MKRVLLVLALLCLTIPVQAAEKVALIIGNANYTNAKRLANPVNDARSMSATLKKLGFKVQEHHDLTESQMHRAIRQFGDSLNKGDVGLFYFSGHGVQVRGKNYLIPVQSDIQREDEVPFQAIDASQVLAKMESAQSSLNMLILDACRDNPYAGQFKSDSKGLARMDAPMGTVLAYATAPGKVASDGVGSNGLFTKHLLKHIEQPGLNISEVLRLTRKDVVMESQKLQHSPVQVPWESSSLLDPFCFVGCLAEVAEVSVAVPTPEPVARSVFGLTVNPTPVDATVSIRNIKPKYYAGMELKPGRYNVRVEAEGYQRDERWVTLGSDDLVLSIELEKQPERLPFEPEMVFIRGGSFMMGSPEGEKGRLKDEKQHLVSVKDFWIGKYEVTFAQWDACVADGGCSHKPNDEGWGRGDRPVINVNWYDANEYARWLGGKTGKIYGLPTEAQWEYAARAGSQTIYPWGDNIDCKQAHYDYTDCNADKPKKVGSYAANNWGLHDTVGNVWEWTCSFYDEAYGGAESRCSTIKGDRVFRGGAWFNDSDAVRSASRHDFDATYRYQSIGFRLLRVLKKEEF